MAIDNDTRGWIMTGISGVACVVGASIICVDVVVRLFPGMHKFSISESDAFLSASLSLSFGVMLYSALYSMLPQSKNYLEEAGHSARAASFILIGFFLAGVVGIRVLSRVLHKFIPSHVVDCDHTHDEEEAKSHAAEMSEQEREQAHAHAHAHAHRHRHDKNIPNSAVVATKGQSTGNDIDEDTPLLSRSTSATPPQPQRTVTAPEGSVSADSQAETFVTAPASRRSSFFPRSLSRTLTKYVSTRKPECDENGPCMGYSSPCGQDCFRAVQKRGPVAISPSLHRTLAWQSQSADSSHSPSSVLGEQSNQHSSSTYVDGRSREPSRQNAARPGPRSRSATHHHHHPEDDRHAHFDLSRRSSVQSHQHSIETDHHHHVPTNAFMSIGLQTSLAIALHKLPEGFITYATNHANPTLGFAVFMALFIHNITEGFALSLPLYLALNSRWKAIVWSAFLGGVSQPLGAGIAALWFKLAANGSMAPNEGVYGGMFAVTSGVMTSVALSLYSESLQLSHNRETCIAFAFLGMGILGVSYALTAK